MRRARRCVAVAVAGVLLLAATSCDGGDDGSDGEGAGQAGPATTEVGTAGTAADGGFEVLSGPLEERGAIPQRFARGGDNVSPPLAWRTPPEGTVEYAVVVDDPDAPGEEPFVHWLVAGIDAGIGELAEGELPEGAVEGENDFGTTGWEGPQPPGGEVHSYRFTVHALGAPSGLDEDGFDRGELEGAIEGEVLASATLTAHYPARDEPGADGAGGATGPQGDAAGA